MNSGGVLLTEFKLFDKTIDSCSIIVYNVEGYAKIKT